MQFCRLNRNTLKTLACNTHKPQPRSHNRNYLEPIPPSKQELCPKRDKTPPRSLSEAVIPQQAPNKYRPNRLKPTRETKSRQFLPRSKHDSLFPAGLHQIKQGSLSLSELVPAPTTTLGHQNHVSPSIPLQPVPTRRTPPLRSLLS